MLELNHFLKDNTISIGLVEKYLLAATAINSFVLANEHIVMLE